ncbi:hypothetical protein CGZ92_10095 [Parenemella sanctibonifatiensis]|uniref:Uncharacterized protein n=1 Tax=Parenemella sanctibonifatiensis TaxID=2016505 RepID=A0A255EB80_9ACTN|nr:hypothetical protein CGZ92_10095 [Parenemella sanctibonifatiensis]
MMRKCAPAPSFRPETASDGSALPIIVEDTSCGYSRDRHDVFEVLENDVTWTWQGDPVTLE